MFFHSVISVIWTLFLVLFFTSFGLHLGFDLFFTWLCFLFFTWVSFFCSLLELCFLSFVFYSSLDFPSSFRFCSSLGFVVRFWLVFHLDLFLFFTWASFLVLHFTWASFLVLHFTWASYSFSFTWPLFLFYTWACFVYPKKKEL